MLRGKGEGPFLQTMNNKFVIYQVFTRLFGNNNTRLTPNGDKAVNGCGRMADFTTKALEEIKGTQASSTMPHKPTIVAMASVPTTLPW